MDKRYDAIVIGAGHNGLVCAATLAKAGQRVLVLERREVLGGAAATEEVFPGFRVNTGAFDAGLFLPQIAAGLRLEAYGLRWIESPAIAFAPQLDGSGLTLWRDPGKTVEEIARFSAADARRYPDYLEQVHRLAGLLQEAAVQTPPSLPETRPAELLPWLRLALKARGMGRVEMMELLRVLPLPAADYLDEWFESPALKGALGISAVLGGRLGPCAAGTTLMLLYQAMGAAQGSPRASRFVQGGAGKLAETLAAAARRHGAEICTGEGVSRIVVEDERAVGVITEAGEGLGREILAGAVISSANPKHTFFDLAGPRNLGVSFVREVKNLRFRSGLARVNLALSGLPRFNSTISSAQAAGDLPHLGGHILVCADLEALERASDEAKYGNVPARPVLDLAIPTLLDGSLAPPGCHLACINVQFVPYTLREGSWDEHRSALGEQVLKTLGEVAPGIQDLILHQQILTPLDLEREYGLAQGDIYHGEIALDQLFFMRPVPGFAQYRSPIEGLYLCGAGTHPGGGLTGAPGYNAAREVLRDLRKRSVV